MSDFFDVRTDSPAMRRATQAFVDAFLAEVMDDLRLVARGCGYALLVHGTRARDIDMLAVPWTSQAEDADFLRQRLLGALAGKFGRAVHHSNEWTEKPHGRRACTILGPGMCPEIDFSVMPRIEATK